MLTHLKGQVTSIPRPGLPVHAEVAVISNIGIGMKYLTGWWTSEILLQSDWEEWGVDNKVRHPPWVRSPLLEFWSGWDLCRSQHCKRLRKNRLAFLNQFNSVVFKQRYEQNTFHQCYENKAFKLKILTWTNSLNPSRSGKLKNLKTHPKNLNSITVKKGVKPGRPWRNRYKHWFSRRQGEDTKT